MEIYKNKNLENLPGEEWVDVLGFDGIFSVSNMGRVKSESRWVDNHTGGYYKKPIIKSQQKRGNGLTIKLMYADKSLWSTVERIVYISFNPNVDIKENQVVAHKNKIGIDNRLSNLVVMTYSDSHRLNFKKGLLPHLEKNNNKKHLDFEKEYVKIKTKKCKRCGQVKSKEKFEKKRYTCNKCRAIKIKA